MAAPAGRQDGANAGVVGQFPLASHTADHAERLGRQVFAQGLPQAVPVKSHRTGRAAFHTSPVCHGLRRVQSEPALRVRNGR